MDSGRFDALSRALITPARSRRSLFAAIAFIGFNQRDNGDAKHAKKHRTGAKSQHRRKRLTGQISGGTVVPPGKYSFAASIRANRGNGVSTLCSGSLIDSSHVLTAAHCTDNPVTGSSFPLEAYTITVGQVDRTATTCAACRKRVTAVAIDPAWTGAGLETIRPHDVAVLTLDSPVAASIAQPIALIDAGTSILDGAGQSTIAAGWGITSTDGSSSTVLMEAPLTVIEDAICGDDPTTQLCTGVAGGRDTCSGDSGAPLFVRVAEATNGVSAQELHAARRRHRRHRHSSPPPPPPPPPPPATCSNGTSCFVQIGVVSGGPRGCPSENGVVGEVYGRLSHPAINAFIRSAMNGGGGAGPTCDSCDAAFPVCCPSGDCCPAEFPVCCPPGSFYDCCPPDSACQPEGCSIPAGSAVGERDGAGRTWVVGRRHGGKSAP